MIARAEERHSPNCRAGGPPAVSVSLHHLSNNQNNPPQTHFKKPPTSRAITAYLIKPPVSAAASLSFMPSMDPVAPQLPPVNVEGGGAVELFYENVEEEKRMAYIVSLFRRYISNGRNFELAGIAHYFYSCLSFLFFEVDDGDRLHARF